MKSWIALFMVLSFVGNAGAFSYDRPKIQLPEPRGYVSDHAQVLDGNWKERIRSVCQDLERKTGVEMVVVTVPSIKPFGSANEYATAIYEKWGIGSAQQEHGVLVLVAVQERQAAMTLGRQMLPVITPTVMNQVGGKYLHPAINLGHFGEGLYRTVVALASQSQEVRVGSLTRTHFKGHRSDVFSLVDQPARPAPSLQPNQKRRVLGNGAWGIRRKLGRVWRWDERRRVQVEGIVRNEEK